MNHWIFNGIEQSLKCYNASGMLVFRCVARGDAVNDGFGHDGKCPPGSYALSAPSENVPATESEGLWFIPLTDPGGFWKPNDRSEIGIHGGGSGLQNPQAPLQGWVPTYGCIRLQNIYLARVAQLVESGDRIDVLWEENTL